ncbi:MAG: glycosyltransferase family 2 protein [Candidatus Latescibacterota bacterium]|nr:MAG: glycosyltransferase family 2 protein [Candidatus Latescibacterota bacterium]
MTRIPMVSIGLPVYNGERYLEQALDSILAQTFTDFEVIISDNASTDRTREICLAYTEADHRVRYVRNERNLGAAENYNRLVWLANGRYFKWAAHDDVCAPGFLARCIEVMEHDDSVVLCYPKSTFIDENGEHIAEFVEDSDYSHGRPHERLRTWLFGKPESWCNPVFGLIRTNTLRKTGLIGKYNASDSVLMGELALRGKIQRIEENLFYRRDHPKRSALAHRGNEARARWFDTSKKRRLICLPRWRWCWEYIKTIARVPIGFREKLRALGVLMKWGNKVRSNLKQDLIAAAKMLVRGPTSSASSVGP